MESEVAENTSEDTQDSGVQFITTLPPHPRQVTGYMLATSLLYMTEFHNKQVLGEQTRLNCGGQQWLYIKGGCLHG